MEASSFRHEVSMPGGGLGQVNYQVRQGIAFRVEAVSFEVDLSGAAGAADVKIRFRSPTNNVIAGALVGSAQAVGTVVQYTLAGNLNPCDAWSDNADAGTPDTWPDISLIEGCSVALDCSDPTTGVEVVGAVINRAMLWVEPLMIGNLADETPLLTPIVAAEQVEAA